jgi:hypothetical protein
MRAGSFDFPPSNGKAVHQLIDELSCIVVRMGAQVGVLGGGQDGAMAEDFLDLEQVDARLDQVGRITVTKAVRGDLFFIPQSAATWRRVACTPPRSSGLVAR